MKTTKEIEEKIKHFEQQKESLAKVSSLENAKEHFEVITQGIVLLDKQISLLKWVLNKQ